MLYFIYYLLLSPLLLLLTLFRKRNNSSKNLIIQTAKIGDYANTSVMFSKLQECDIILDQINLPFAEHDKRIKNIFIMNKYKKGILKFKLLFKIFNNNYENVYIVMPNSFNLFIGLCSFAKNKITLSTYTDKWYTKLLSFNMKITTHTLDDLTIESYLKMIDQDTDIISNWKKLQEPLYIPKEIPVTGNKFKIGVSLTAANKLKTIDINTWKKVFDIIDTLEIEIYIFGLTNEAPLLEELKQNITLKNSKIISLLGKTKLVELPFTVSLMDLYISSDTGNCYIADSVKVPTINFAGPCFWVEQRPVNEKSLIVKSNATCTPYSSVFKTVSEKRCEDIFTINKKQEIEITTFIESCYKKKK